MKNSDFDFLWVNIVGQSMKPILFENDIVMIKHSSIYDQGDIVVFRYWENICLAHRILIHDQDGMYFCKGDNSFRMEKITHEDILGKVVFVKRNEKIFCLPIVSDKFIFLSIAVNEEFVNNEYNLKDTIKSTVYKEYLKERDMICIT